MLKYVSIFFTNLAYEITSRQPLLYNHKLHSNPDSTNLTETVELIKNLCTMSEVRQKSDWI